MTRQTKGQSKVGTKEKSGLADKEKVTPDKPKELKEEKKQSDPIDEHKVEEKQVKSEPKIVEPNAEKVADSQPNPKKKKKGFSKITELAVPVNMENGMTKIASMISEPMKQMQTLMQNAESAEPEPLINFHSVAF